MRRRNFQNENGPLSDDNGRQIQLYANCQCTLDDADCLQNGWHTNQCQATDQGVHCSVHGLGISASSGGDVTIQAPDKHTDTDKSADPERYAKHQTLLSLINILILPPLPAYSETHRIRKHQELPLQRHSMRQHPESDVYKRQTMTIAASRSPKFKPAAPFKQKLN